MTTIISLLNKLGSQAELANLNETQLTALAKAHGLNTAQINLLLAGDTNALEQLFNTPKVVCQGVHDPKDVPDQEDSPAKDDKIQQAI
ncbi:hypothetical protein RGQ13_04435 [Thalassotalea psychrophila]|uniref:Uncharacterized protein n=1 Tax=Thalassotalea psychrophila TaxID=3065647 RepID=A0ABY9TY28_9GAMM|nr:hypothetical protein RGQ13_04435 [Colwelliaceae bacterium SQ149]